VRKTTKIKREIKRVTKITKIKRETMKEGVTSRWVMKKIVCQAEGIEEKRRMYPLRLSLFSPSQERMEEVVVVRNAQNCVHYYLLSHAHLATQLQLPANVLFVLVCMKGELQSERVLSICTHQQMSSP